ncbi:MAG: hemagglutinin repeat-containing protein, partial [Pseudomonadota bacterium]|nr:hemagglutinin repeat-containing protein [Pseudomonadota bacterium]
LNAQKGYYNLGGKINGDVVFANAANIHNITRHSKAARHYGSNDVGRSGVINGRSMAFLNANAGNVENHGGIIRAGNYLEITAQGDVLNNCNIKSHQGKYDVIKTFDHGLIAGGDGQDREGLGLYIKAEGKVVADASDFISNGDNYIEGVQGVNFKARHHTYVAKDEHEKSSWGFSEKHKMETATNVQGSVVHSNHGRNSIYSGEGKVKSVATLFSSPGGTDVYSDRDVKLFSLKTHDQTYKSKSSCWGLSESERYERHQKATPTLFVDNGRTRIHSAKGNVDARGAYFTGEGDLYVKAGKRVKFGVDILQHEVREKSRSLGVSVPGMNAWQTARNGGNLWDMASSEDATLAKLNSLCGSHTNAEQLTNASNLGIDVYNTSSNLMNGLGNGTLGNELMSRYGLGGANGFSPSVKFSLTETETHSKYQTQGVGGVNRGGKVYIEAGDGVDLENGVAIKAAGDIEINAPELIMRAAKLDSSFSQKSQTYHVGVSPTGGVTDVGYNQSTSKMTSTSHMNATLMTGGNLNLHHQGEAMEKVELDGGNILAQTLDAKIKRLILTDKQDETKVKNQSIGASSSGQISYYQGEGSSKRTQQHSGIFVEEGINNNGHSVTVDKAEMKGGEITTNGVNNFSANKIKSTALVDKEDYQGKGFSLNVKDLVRLTEEHQPTGLPGEKAIATGTVIYDKKEYEAEQRPVIFGQGGTAIEAREIPKNIVTTRASGTHVKTNETQHFAVDVPMIKRPLAPRPIPKAPQLENLPTEVIVLTLVPDAAAESVTSED